MNTARAATGGGWLRMSSAPERPADRPGDPGPDRIAAAILAAVAALEPGKTLCPGEVARALAHQDGADDPQVGDDAWRAWLKPVRRTAIALARAGRISIYRKGRPVSDPDAVRGVIRLGTPAP